MANDSLEQLALHTIGGGWGSETEDATNNVRVSVIRGTDIPRLRVGDFTSVPVRYESGAKVKNRLLKPGDIVIEVSGGSAASGQHTGRALLVTQKIIDSLGGNVIPASFCRLLRLDAARGNPNFIVYQIDALHLTGEISEFENQSTGIANFQFSRFVQETFPRIDDLRSQATIAHILGTLDAKIELNRKQNETLEAMARTLFNAWFVDFEPVRAKLEGRWQRGQSLPGLPAQLYDLFPDRLVESELGEIPQGWEMRSLDSIANYLNGLALQKFPPESETEFLPVIKIAQLRAGNTTGADKASTRIKPEYVVVDGDVLFSWSGSLEVEVWNGGRGALNQHLFKVTSNEVPKWFYFFATRHHLSDFRAIAAGKATTMGHIQRKHLTDARIAVAPLESMRKFDAVIAPLFDQLVSNAQQSRSLAQLRDTLLPKLISGELRVPDAERILGA